MLKKIKKTNLYRNVVGILFAILLTTAVIKSRNVTTRDAISQQNYIKEVIFLMRNSDLKISIDSAEIWYISTPIMIHPEGVFWTPGDPINSTRNTYVASRHLRAFYLIYQFAIDSTITPFELYRKINLKNTDTSYYCLINRNQDEIYDYYRYYSNGKYFYKLNIRDSMHIKLFERKILTWLEEVLVKGIQNVRAKGILPMLPGFKWIPKKGLFRDVRSIDELD